MEDDGSPLNNFGKGLKKLFGKSRRGSGEDLTEQEIMSMVNPSLTRALDGIRLND